MILHVLNLSPAAQIYENLMNPVTDKLPIGPIGLFVACYLN